MRTYVLHTRASQNLKELGMSNRAGSVLPETEKPTVLTQILENRNRYGTEI